MRKLRLHNDDCGNGTTAYLQKYLHQALSEFPLGEFVYVELGSAWGGNLQYAGELLRDKGIVYGFDTFSGMPKHLGLEEEKNCIIRGWGHNIPNCMDVWYAKFDPNELTYSYQRQVLDENALNNVILVKGEVNENSLDNIPYVNYAFLDMDLLVPMQIGYEAIKNKLVSGGYLLLHDVVNNLPLLMQWYEEIKGEGIWEIVEEVPNSYLAILRKK
jgi:hypothetical protein